MNYKIVSLEASNIKVLKAVHITPDKNVVTLSGPNGAGKSSVLDAIAFALGGKDAICDQPIRRGASKAEIICKLNGLTVTRNFTPTGTTLKVTNDEGTPQKTPQAILDALVGNLSFDPLSFARMLPAQQLATLRQLVGLDFTAQDAERARLYNERTIINREHDNARTLLASMPHHPGVPESEVSVAELNQQLAQANAVNSANAQRRSALTSAQADVDTAKQAVTRQNAEVERLRTLLEQATTEVNRLQSFVEQKVQTLKEMQAEIARLQDVDTAALSNQIIDADLLNRKIRSNATRKQHESVVTAKKKESDTLTAKMEAIDKAKQDALTRAQFPLPGLTFDDGAVLFNGIPFTQLSDGEKLRVSVAVGMALNPQLRVIFIRDGSLLDADGLRTVAELAEKNDYQVWLEDARSTDPTALVIEAGEIKEVA